MQQLARWGQPPAPACCTKDLGSACPCLVMPRLLDMLALGRALLQACACVHVEAAGPWGRASWARLPGCIMRHLLLLPPALWKAVLPPGVLWVGSDMST